MLTMRSNHAKLTPPPPVPPRPSKTVVAEALAKSRKLSPVRALYATQPLSASKPVKDDNKPVVPIRTAPPPPAAKPKLPYQVAHHPQPQVVKSFSSAAVFHPKPRSAEQEPTKIVRSISDCSEEPDKNRTLVFQSPNIKTSKIEVTIGRNKSVETTSSLNTNIENATPRNTSVETTKNERNKELSTPTEEKQTITVTTTLNQRPSTDACVIHTASDPRVTSLPDSRVDDADNMVHCVQINTTDKKPDVITVTSNESEQPSKEVSDTIVQSSAKTMIIVTSSNDDANNNVPVKTSDVNQQIGDDSEESSVEKSSADSTAERKPKKVQFDDNVNHETLIAELQSMHEEQERLLRRQRKPPIDIYEENDTDSRIHHSDWVEVANGEEVRLSSCQIYIDNASEDSKSSSLSSRRSSRVPSMSSLHGLPPLPKSLSGFNLLEGGHRVETPRGAYRVPASPGPQTPSRAGSSRGPTPPTPSAGSGHVVYPPHPPRINGTTELPRGRKITTLDTQLAILRREMQRWIDMYKQGRTTAEDEPRAPRPMSSTRLEAKNKMEEGLRQSRRYGLRQLDLSLLSQLYSLNEAIQDFRQILQDQEDSALSPHSPSPSPSSGDEGDEFYSPTPMRFKPAPPAPPLRRTSNSSSANSSEYGTV